MSIKLPDTVGGRFLSYAPMAFQAVILVCIATILLSAFGLVGVSTAASMVVMFLLGLPLLILLYTSSTDKSLRAVFLGLIGNITLLSISGIIWYLISDLVDIWWLIPLAKVIMVVGYLPLIFALYSVYQGEKQHIDKNIRIFVLSFGLCFFAGLALLGLLFLPLGSPFDIGIYTLSVIGDIIVLDLSAMLIVIRPSFRSRYIFSILFLFILVSFCGDMLRLSAALGIADARIGLYSNYFYDFMLIFLVTGLLIYSFFKDDSKDAVEEANRKLGDTRHAMDDLLSQMPDAACMFTPEGHALIVNEPFLWLFGVRRDDMLAHYNLFAHAASLQCDFKERLKALKEGRAVLLEMTKIALSGREVFISFKIFPTFAMDGSISSYIAICEDVTSRARAEEELKQAKAIAELYLDLMGHDINNMNQVGMGYLEIALDTFPFEAGQKGLLLKPLEAMTNSSRLIDNVKKLSRASKGDIYLQPMDLGKVIKEAISEHGQSPGRDVVIVNEVADGTMVRANELLKDVFINLVGNAIKHSGGKITINIRQEPFYVDGMKYDRIFVDDNGPGISDDMKPLIFDRLMRVNKRTGGSGIGLYLVKTLIDSYGGNVSVEDRVPGDRTKGTRFIVTLPAA